MDVKIEAIVKRYQSTVALDGVSLEIVPGQIVAVLGPNGAGKTTLLRCLAGIAVPNDGSILYDGERFRRDRLDLRRRFCFMPDFPFLYPDMTVIQHLGMVLRLYDADRDGVEETVIDLLSDFDMLPLAEARIGTLSRGQTYKAALAALLAADVELWMLDEPFASGMDPRGISAFKQRCREAAADGRTVLYTTQILDVAEKFSDRVCILHHGRVHAFQDIEQLRSRTYESEEGVLEEVFQQLHEEAE